jgi:hypoxanthine phosphoribosyltransferase
LNWNERLNPKRHAIENLLDNIEVLISAEELAERNRELGAKITADFAGESLHVIGVLKGCFVFLADLVRHIDLDVSCDFLSVSSYGASTKSSGVVRMIRDLSEPIEGRHVLLVEDIVDTGLTMKYLLENVKTRQPKSVSVCTLLHKPAGRQVEVPIHYTGFTIPDKFVIGYGLDYIELYRNLPYIGYVPQIEEQENADE